MKKIAVFVEGQTEEIFIIELIQAIAGTKGITFEIVEQFCGLLQAVELRSVENSDFYFLIVNCNTDSQVKSQIKKQHQSLAESGYTAIIGLRDVYPLKHADLADLRSYNYVQMPTDAPPITLVLAILEVEAWFLAELNHFIKLHPDMTPVNIVSKGNDVINIQPEDWEHPAGTLKNIYKNWNLGYSKTRKHVERTVGALDFNEMFLKVRPKSASFNELVDSLESAMFTA